MVSLILLVSTAASAETLVLNLGESRSIPAGQAATVRVGSRGIVRVAEDEKRIRVMAMKPGTTTVSVDSQNYLIHVLGYGQGTFYKKLAEWVKSHKGLYFEWKGGMLIIKGKLLRFSDWLELADLARTHSAQYEFEANPYAEAAQQAIQHFRETAQRDGLPILRVTADPAFTMWIPKSSLALKEQTQRLFSPFGISIRSSDSMVNIEPQIRTHVVLAEVTKSFSRHLGVTWPSQYEARVIPKLSGDGEVLATLNALEAQGKAQVLAAPNLLCRSGGEAEFHAGGEFPIRMLSKSHGSVAWKKHGVILKVKPKADFSGAISLSIHTEISLLDMAHSVEGLPAVKSNTVSSYFDLPGRRTIALSGLLRQDWSETQEGLPFLSAVPILGRLFGSKAFQNQQSELIVFVTPEIHTPDSDTAIEMPKGWVYGER